MTSTEASYQALVPFRAGRLRRRGRWRGDANFLCSALLDCGICYVLSDFTPIQSLCECITGIKGWEARLSAVRFIEGSLS